MQSYLIIINRINEIIGRFYTGNNKGNVKIFSEHTRRRKHLQKKEPNTHIFLSIFSQINILFYTIIINLINLYA